jgi:hypothetical protein
VVVTRLGRTTGSKPSRPGTGDKVVARRGHWVRGHYWPHPSNLAARAKYGFHYRPPHFRQGIGEAGEEVPKVRRYRRSGK